MCHKMLNDEYKGSSCIHLLGYTFCNFSLQLDLFSENMRGDLERKSLTKETKTQISIGYCHILQSEIILGNLTLFFFRNPQGGLPDYLQPVTVPDGWRVHRPLHRSNDHIHQDTWSKHLKTCHQMKHPDITTKTQRENNLLLWKAYGKKKPKRTWDSHDETHIFELIFMGWNLGVHLRNIVF